MKRVVPYIGEHAGKLCYRLDDGSLELAPERDPSRWFPPAVCLPEVPASDHPRSGVEASGEIAGYDTRGSIARMTRELTDNGFSRPAERAMEAAQTWDRGVRSGEIKRYC